MQNPEAFPPAQWVSFTNSLNWMKTSLLHLAWHFWTYVPVLLTHLTGDLAVNWFQNFQEEFSDLVLSVMQILLTDEWIMEQHDPKDLFVLYFKIYFFIIESENLCVTLVLVLRLKIQGWLFQNLDKWQTVVPYLYTLSSPYLYTLSSFVVTACHHKNQAENTLVTLNHFLWCSLMFSISVLVECFHTNCCAQLDTMGSGLLRPCRHTVRTEVLNQSDNSDMQKNTLRFCR